MKKIIIFGCIGLLFLVGLISTTIFAVLYINSQNEIKVKNAELVACSVNKNTSAAETAACVESAPTEYTFRDEGLDITVTYPTSWSGALTTKTGDDYIYEATVSGKLMSGYEYNVTKGGATLKFKKILAGVDGFGDGLKAATSDWAEVTGTNLIRVSEKGANDWKYVQKVDCSTFGEPLYDPAVVATFDVCTASFFPGFGKDSAVIATIKTSNATLLEEADQIAKSALN